MTTLIRATDGKRCSHYQFEGGASSWEIDYSVGLNGVNRREDVLKIQELLNLIAVVDGGPATPLVEDGWIGPLTIGAIRNFQQFHKTASDSRVDPGGPTLKKMNEVPKHALAERNAARLGRVARAMPDLIQMATKGLRMIEGAMDYLSLGEGLTTSKRTYEMANLHFKLDGLSDDHQLDDLRLIHTTYRRVRTVLMSRSSGSTGGNPFGVSIFTIDPMGRNHVAYSPKQTSDAKRIPEVHPGHVYLCRAYDQMSSFDGATHVLFHELFHFADDELKHGIGDHGYRERAMQLTHDQRMHNADNYALFGSHSHFGRDRLLLSQPFLRPHLPPELG